MTSRMLCITAMMLFAVTIPAQLSAQDTDKRARMVGWADTSAPDPDPNYCLVSGYDCHVAHAFQWRNGIETDLESLPGGASSVAFWVNSSGLSVGFAESGQSEEVSTANLIMTDRKSLEKVGVFPDERILAKPEDIVRGRDPVRARAAELGGVKITPDEAGPTATDSGSGPPIIDGPGWVRDHNTTFSSTRTGHCEAICPSIRCPQLDGYCVGLVRRVCQRRYVGGRDCPVHAPARRMVGECGVYVDPTTFCTP